MKYAYGFNKQESDFAHLKDLELRNIFLDFTKPPYRGYKKRELRTDMVDMALQAGDEIYVVDEKDLGTGNHMQVIAKMGVPVHFVPAKVPPKKTPGPKRKHTITPDQRRRLEQMWFGASTATATLDQLEVYVGERLNRAWLNNNIGLRTGKKRGQT